MIYTMIFITYYYYLLLNVVNFVLHLYQLDDKKKNRKSLNVNVELTVYFSTLLMIKSLF